MDQMVRNDIACNCIPSLELLFGTHTFHFNCFFEDFNCVFTQIRCLSRVLKSCDLPVKPINSSVLNAQMLIPLFIDTNPTAESSKNFIG